ncbi:D-alanyl-D-alanine carboxypeptidase [Pseudanabaena sp. PCC 6802]|uniref:D-alanyl-D-alanine carboxypeptidase n=1 Tax=Pseudanabaena sp. PCC 6802 TaxID=118173 RepID=UPI000346169C|nr:D-alanyl-D-alanine carboxypeptidase [Pseudanabaena sp. PCC 6802]
MLSLFGSILLTASVQYFNDTPRANLPVSLFAAISTPTLALEPVGSDFALDPTAAEVVKTLLLDLKASGYSELDQGVWIQTNSGALLATHQGTRPLPAASLTKLATTLAALSTWEPDFQVVTIASTRGEIVGNTLQGDLIVQGSGDPVFVWEEAIAMANALNRLGIQRVQGNLIVTGFFAMNFETDPQKSANLLQRAFDSANWDDEILKQYAKLPQGTPKPRIAIAGATRYELSIPSTSATKELVRHSSVPLRRMLQLMNIYSNNTIAEMLATSMGGREVVIQKASSAAGISPEQIRLINGSGLGQQNQISPQAAVAILIALQNRARSLNLTLADLLPVSDCKCGTIDIRHLPPGALVKTGTLSDVSALAGMLPTRDRGPIWFAIINRGEGDIETFHNAQDRLLRSLNQKWGGPNALLTNSFTSRPWQDTNRDRLMLER